MYNRNHTSNNLKVCEKRFPSLLSALPFSYLQLLCSCTFICLSRSHTPSPLTSCFLSSLSFFGLSAFLCFCFAVCQRCGFHSSSSLYPPFLSSSCYNSFVAMAGLRATVQQLPQRMKYVDPRIAYNSINSWSERSAAYPTDCNNAKVVAVQKTRRKRAVLVERPTSSTKPNPRVVQSVTSTFVHI